jgi:hypothetical protein
MSASKNSGSDGIGVGKVRSIVAGLIADTILEVAFGISLVIGRIFEQLNGALLSAGSALGSPLRSGGSQIIGVVSGLGGAVLDLTGAAGPAAPLVAVVLVAAVVWLIGLGIRITLGGVQWLT